MNGGSCRALAEALAGSARKRGPAADRAADAADAAADRVADAADTADADRMAGAAGSSRATGADGSAGREDSAGATLIGVGCMAAAAPCFESAGLIVEGKDATTSTGARATRSGVEIDCNGKSRASRLRLTPTKRAWRFSTPVRTLER
jgi:hypothetical protein